MAWKDGFVIDYTASQDARHAERRSCRNCVHYQGEMRCGITGLLHPDVGLKSWRWCGRFVEDKERLAERAKRKRLVERTGKSKGKKKKPSSNKLVEKERAKPSGRPCKVAGCSRIADAGKFCKFHASRS